VIAIAPIGNLHPRQLGGCPHTAELDSGHDAAVDEPAHRLVADTLDAMTSKLAATVLVTVIAACAGSAATPAQPEATDPPATTVAATPTPATEVTAVALMSFRHPVESGFAPCCGNDSFRLDIRCRDRLMRCYEQNDVSGWKQTYGRHCKRALTEACYLDGCSNSC
jgi:hypothetical protein